MKKIPHLIFWLCFATFSVSAKGNNKQPSAPPPNVIKSDASTCLHSRDADNLKICTALADGGDAIAQNTLGEIFYGDNLLYQKGDHTKARLLFEKAAAQGLAKAQYNLGAMYRDELNNFPIALSWFEKAAAQGDLDAQNSIGYIYENASGGKPPRLYIFDENGKNIDPELPNIEAQFARFDKMSLPLEDYPRSVYPLSEYGQGVEPDIQKAIEWYQKAASQGHALAQTNLAYFYLLGIGVEKDEQKAFTLYQQAANQQLPAAIKTLGFLYMQGLGTEVDEYKAFTLFEQAYQLQPDDNLIELIRIYFGNTYNFRTPLEWQDINYRLQYDSHTEISDEDFIYDRFHSFNAFYDLDMANSWIMLDFSKWPRNTMDILLGNTIGERSELKERLYIKRAIQGYPKTLASLSYYYKGEERDIIRAQLWRKYALKMGASNHPSEWPNYPPILADEFARRRFPRIAD
ncbi:sel1 repeat family protein [Gilliamella sp. B3172]|uniref:tetratricopeptide repeat protein n=1 Tax=Gilliamella sp. B3172 TaxID=2818006 RepID=UPI00226AC489|nr:tetratricopeptide repeat protein [Gilliamella sp. B3172]MCX8639339.1 sel1 repeat family protein [Gilliamella sp. B3172]